MIKQRELMEKLKAAVFYVEVMLVGIGAFAVLFVAGFCTGYIVEKFPIWMEALK
jgi:hypothetical protein